MSWAYVTLKVAHVVAVIVAFGTLLPAPILRRKLLASAPQCMVASSAAVAVSDVALAGACAALWVRKTVSEPAFVLVGVFGVWLGLAHPDDTIFGQLWVRLAVGLFAFALVVVLFLQGPLARRGAHQLATLLSDPSDPGNADLAKKLAFSVWALEILTVVSALGLVGMLVLMITQPT